MNNITYEIGNTKESILIMKEAAEWLIDTDKPMWRIEDIQIKL